MGHNSMVSGHPKSTGIPRVDGLSTGPMDLRCHRVEVGTRHDGLCNPLATDIAEE